MWTSRETDLRAVRQIGLDKAIFFKGDGRVAFTLVEIMTSIVILALLLLFLGRILSDATGSWSLGEANTQRLQNVQAIGEFMGDELQAALLPIDRSNQASLHFVVNPSGAPSISGSLFGNRDAIFWQTPLATDRRLGDVAEVGYFVHWDTTSNASNPRARLCRFFLNPVQSDRSTIAPEPDYLIYSDPANWLSDGIIERVVPIIAASSSSQAASYVGLFAENVLGLWVTCRDSASNLIATDASGEGFVAAGFPSQLGYDSRRGYHDPNHPFVKRLPSVIDVSYVMVDSSSAALITPAIHRAILDLYKTADNADRFVEQALTDPQDRFRAIKSSLRSYETRVSLQNSK